MSFERGSRPVHLFRRLFAAVCLLGPLAAGGAHAQNFNAAVEAPADSVTMRTRPDYDAVGIRAGSFVIKPRLTVSETYDDNIYATSAARKSDFITDLKPRLEARSQWNRHEMGVTVEADIGRHASATTEDYTNFTARFDGRLDVGGADSLSANAYFQKYQEPRSSVDDPRGVTPVKIDDGGGELVYRHRGGAIAITARAAVSDSTFHNTRRADGSIINNHDRDRTVATGSLEFGLDNGGMIRPFVQVNGIRVNFKLPVDDFGLNRDSTGYAVNGGLLFPITALIQGRVFGGYIARHFEDPALTDIHAANYGARLIWSPTRSTSVSAEALKTIEETTLDQSSAALVSSFSLGLDHELRENLLLHMDTRYERDRYQGIVRRDNFWSGNAELTYLMNRRLRATLAYEYSQRNANAFPSLNDYKRNRITLGLRFQL